MAFLKACGLAICAALSALILRRMRPDMSVAISLAGGALLLIFCLPMLSEIITSLSDFSRQGGVQEGYLTQLLKVAGISLLADFAAQTCRDAGEEGLAVKTELAGRIMLLSLALPVMRTLLSSILSLSP